MVGVKKIGEAWVNETMLFNYIKEIFQEYEVLREYSPKWLNKQRFDIFIKELNLAIEYQGEQHYKPIGRFGGIQGFENIKKRDETKRKKSKENGVEIIYFSYKEELTLDFITEKLQKYISKAIIDNN